MGKDKHKKHHGTYTQQPHYASGYNPASQYLTNLPTVPDAHAQQPYPAQFPPPYPSYPSQHPPPYHHQASGSSQYSAYQQQHPGQGYQNQGRIAAPGASSSQMMIMCVTCSMKLYAPRAGGLFKCPSCNTTQRLPSEMEDQLRSTYGISCSVPGCSCQGYVAGASANPRDGQTDHGDHRDKSSTHHHHHRHICTCCGHKKSMHEIGSKEVKATLSLPKHWEGDLTKSTRKQVSKETKKAVQDLMDVTWKSVATKDRQGDKTVPSKFEVVQVLRNQNPKIWMSYARKREIIREEMRTHHSKDALTPKTAKFLEHSTELEPLLRDCNEMYLFHGTKPSAADSIAQNDFKMSFSGSNRGTLLGQGIYFAESSSKSDEYAEDDQDGLYQGLYATLLCRVVMGNYNLNEEHQPNADELAKSCSLGKYHSVLGDREKIRGTFREFVVFNNDQAYPEFIVIYRRIFC